MSALERRPGNEQRELLLRNGHAVFNSQTHFQALSTIFESNETQKPESLLKCGDSFAVSCNFSEDETASWFQEPLNNSMDKEFSNYFYEMPTSEPDNAVKVIKEDSNICANQSSFHPQETVTPLNSCLDDGNIINILNPGMTDLGITSKDFGEEVSNCRMKTIFSSVCDNRRETKNPQQGFMNDLWQENINEPSIASSSGGSSCCFVRTALPSTANLGLKRKGRNAGESEGHNDDAEYKSAVENKRAERLESGHRSRPAQVHNLSEKRRRGRINEKMRELQELIPHCNKLDKASMLDEAIEYLKSLQLQLQFIWMESETATVLFPNIHRLMSLMAIGMNNHSSMENLCSLQDPSFINSDTQMQNFHLPEQY